MAKQYRKLQKKIHPPAPKPKPRASYGKDYFLLAVIVFTGLIFAVAWQSLDAANITLYSLLLTSLCITYARRHIKLTEKQDYYLEKIGIVATITALFFFIFVFYRQFIAE